MKYPITRLIKYIKRKHSERRANFYKLVFFLIIVHGLVMVSTSYYLAWLGRENVLEGLSSTLISEIVAPFVAYSISRLTENFFEHNKTNFHEPIKDSVNEESEG